MRKFPYFYEKKEMPSHSYFVLLAFILLGFVLILIVSGLKRDGLDFVGTPSIDKYYFYTGKVATFTTWALFILKALNPKLGYFNFPPHVSWIATAMLWAGSVLIAVSMFTLGRSLRIGLPGSGTALRTGGIYRLSRNPLYTGVYMISIASCLYFPDLINLFCVIYGIYFHHQIVKGEEVFLSGRFGQEWDDYKARVRRYI